MDPAILTVGFFGFFLFCYYILWYITCFIFIYRERQTDRQINREREMVTKSEA